MADLDDLVLPDNGFQTRGSRQLLWDVWFALRSKTGLNKLLNVIADRVLTRPVPVLDANWKPTPENVWTGLEIGALRQNFKNTRGDIAGVKADLASARAEIAALKASIPVAINGAVATALANAKVTATTDNTAIANAVVDVIYTRIKSNTTGA